MYNCYYTSDYYFFYFYLVLIKKYMRTLFSQSEDTSVIIFLYRALKSGSNMLYYYVSYFFLYVSDSVVLWPSSIPQSLEGNMTHLNEVFLQEFMDVFSHRYPYRIWHLLSWLLRFVFNLIPFLFELESFCLSSFAASSLFSCF